MVFLRGKWRDRDREGTLKGDLKAFFGRGAAINWWAAFGAIAVPTVIGVAFIYDAPKGEYRPPEVEFVTSWPANRSIEEIKAQQAKDLPAELAAKAAEKAAEEARKAEFRKLAGMVGMDVEEASK